MVNSHFLFVFVQLHRSAHLVSDERFLAAQVVGAKGRSLVSAQSTWHQSEVCRRLTVSKSCFCHFLLHFSFKEFRMTRVRRMAALSEIASRGACFAWTDTLASKLRVAEKKPFGS
jgi:hypothetical protein